jgi:hypothetical protein
MSECRAASEEALEAASFPRLKESVMESSEHVAVGNTVILDLGNGNTASGADVPLLQGSSLTYGHFVALGGDFYGQPAAVGTEPVPISDAAPDEASGETAFLAAWGTLLNAVQNPSQPAGYELATIVEIIGEEQEWVNRAVAAGRPPSYAYAQLGDRLSLEWNEATGGAPANEGKFMAWWNPGRYLLLAYRNMDHFAGDAYFAYKVGHNAAMKAAAKLNGQNLGTPAAHQALLACYAMNAFADHFLTDLFSSGHLRTPRRPLYNLSLSKSYMSGQLARVMHDEDCQYGVRVTSANYTAGWMAYGDGYERDPINADNWAQAQLAVQASASEIIHAATTGQIAPNPAALGFTPILDPFVPMPIGNGAAVNIALFEPGGKQVGWMGELESEWCVVCDEAACTPVAPVYNNGNLYFTRASDAGNYYLAPAGNDKVGFYGSQNEAEWTLNQDETEMTSTYTGYSLSHCPGASPDYLWAYKGDGYTPLSVEFHDPAGQPAPPQASATPIADFVQQALSRPNYAPLFWADGDGHNPSTGWVYRRGGIFGDWTDRNDFSYTYYGWSAAKMVLVSLVSSLWPNT